MKTIRNIFKTLETEAADAGSASFFNRNVTNPFPKSAELTAEFQRGYDHAKLSDKKAREDFNLFNPSNPISV